MYTTMPEKKSYELVRSYQEINLMKYKRSTVIFGR